MSKNATTIMKDATKLSYKSRIMFIVVLVFVASCWLKEVHSPGLAFGFPDEEHNQASNRSGQETIQQMCLVMPDNKIDMGIFVEYQEQKVYFCCSFCRAAFQKDPEKYLHNLPRFSQTSSQEHHHGQTVAASPDSQHEHPSGLRLINFIKPMGIATLALLTSTVLMGVFRRKKPKLLVKWHKRLGITTLIVAIIHATLVFIAH